MKLKVRSFCKKIIFFGLLIAIPSFTIQNIASENYSNISKNIETEKELLKIKELSNEIRSHLLKEGAISAESAGSDLRDYPPESTTSTNKIDKNNQPNKKIFDYSFNKSKDRFVFNLSEIGKITLNEISSNEQEWKAKIKINQEINLESTQQKLDIPEFGSIYLNFSKDGSILLLKVQPNKDFKDSSPEISRVHTSLKLTFKKNSIANGSRRKSRKRLVKTIEKIKPVKNKAIKLPLGDISTGTLVLKNRAFIELEGPKISMTLQNSPAKNALLQIAKLGDYGFIYVNDDDLKNTYTPRKNIVNDELQNIKGPKVTLTFKDEEFAKAFNSILLASGLQAKKEGNLIMVGSNVLGKSFKPQLSKVYRLNQASASSAADYLASLGATINKVNVVSSTSKVTSNNSNNSKSNAKFTLIDSYSASNGPLRGLIGTTDSRLQTITLIGDSKLIAIAEKYIKQLDLRQRQVALSVKILDVELLNNDSKNLDTMIRSGSTFLINKNGSLSALFGKYIPVIPALTPSVTTTTTTGGVTTTSSSSAETVLPNPGLSYPDKELYSYLLARIQSSSTNVLANPTLILSESREKITGGKEEIGQIDGGSAFIGRPFANESFVTVGTRVVTDTELVPGVDGRPDLCDTEFSIAGLTFGAKVHKIDDNGYVTFTLSPKLTSISETYKTDSCGTVNILSVRRLDTGTLRVKDSQTLIMSGVLSNLDTNVVTKMPILGDLPIVGNLFRSSSKTKRKSELIIMVTPKIINDSDIDLIDVGYSPQSELPKNTVKDIPPLKE